VQGRYRCFHNSAETLSSIENNPAFREPAESGQILSCANFLF
jgi:hypothetical protein